jgi:hypothetical protein
MFADWREWKFIEVYSEHSFFTSDKVNRGIMT